jgi:hypothetical protein
MRLAIQRFGLMIGWGIRRVSLQDLEFAQANQWNSRTGTVAPALDADRQQ